MERFELHVSSVVQTRTETTVVVRAYRLGAPVITAEGTTIPRTLAQTRTLVLGPVFPWARFTDVLRERAAEVRAQIPALAGLEIVCDL